MSETEIEHDCDCLVIGGGPAGLTAAIYLARFHLDTLVIDGGDSRAAWIPRTRNHAGFPDGIAGTELLTRMRAQATGNGARIVPGRATKLEKSISHFLASGDFGVVHARAVLLATGVVNRRPPMLDDALHDDALAAGLLRYCPICDGYEATDARIAVLGTGERGTNEAVFLRSYSADVTLVALQDGHVLSEAEMARLADGGIAIGGACGSIALDGAEIVLDIEGAPTRFETLYPALGSDIRSELAGQLGAARSGDGCLTVDAHQRTDVPGLYAAGDVVKGLDQISHAMGEGGVAATTMRNDLAKVTPIRRSPPSPLPPRHRSPRARDCGAA